MDGHTVSLHVGQQICLLSIHTQAEPLSSSSKTAKGQHFQNQPGAAIGPSLHLLQLQPPCPQRCLVLRAMELQRLTPRLNMADGCSWCLAVMSFYLL